MKTSWSRIALYIAIIGMESCWLFAILALVNGLVLQGRLSIIGLLALYPIAFGINTIVVRFRLPQIYLNLISWSIWAGAMLLLVKLQLYSSLALWDQSWLKEIPAALRQAPYDFRPEFLLFISSIVIWWLGQRLVRLKADFPRLVVEFQFGMPALIVTFIIGSYFTGALEHAVLIAVAFFAFALSGLSISHARQTDGSISQIYRARWLGILITGISLVIVLGVLSGSTVNPEFFERILNTAKWGWEIAKRVLIWAASLLPTFSPTEIPAAGEMPGEIIREPAGSGIFGMPQWIRSIMKFALFINIAFWCIFALWRASGQILNWLNQRLAGMAGVKMESLSGAFTSDVTRLVKRILGRFLIFLLQRLGRKTRVLSPELASIQQVYCQMVRWATARGCPRHPTQTAYEYQSSLVNLFPDFHEEFSLITRQFVGVRYGGLAPAGDELLNLRQSWQRIRKVRRGRPS
ncbi:MAG: DUF4129 domain-containing protein [Dehalococcoidales bacterium]|nr:DUF4129 domain-containing protein [Dehalococcoidales bacterium]